MFGGQAGATSALDQERTQIDGVIAGRLIEAQRRVDLGPDLVTAATDGGTEVDVEIGARGAPASNQLQALFEDSGGNAAPACVEQCNAMGGRIDDPDRDAIRDAHREEERRPVGGDR
jgi:hypothetical protein